MKTETHDAGSNFRYIVMGAITLLLVLAIFQTYQISLLSKQLSGIGTAGSGTGTGISVSSVDVIPKGVPAIYGRELGISYDDVSVSNPAKADETIVKLGDFDNAINLTGSLLTRYISITGSISCEYCCGAPSIIFTSDVGGYKAGDAACGCAHSYAMRGLAKYLLKNHASEYTDTQILEELGKWKTLFFPDMISAKAAILQSQGIELNYVNLASNKYRGIEQQSGSSGGGMVGGC